MTDQSERDAVLEHLRAHRDDLEEEYQRVLRTTLFTNRSEVRPALLPAISTTENETLHDYFRKPLKLAATERGRRHCRLGLSEEAVLGLGQVSRQFCLTHLQGENCLSALQTIESYHSAVVQGFIETRKLITLEEQERIRSGWENVPPQCARK